MKKNRLIRESDIQKAILDYLTALRIFHFRLPLGGVFGHSKAGQQFFRPSPLAGAPDILGILPNAYGRLFGIEVKKPGAKLQPKQSAWREKFLDAGAVHIIATSVEDVRQMLDLYREKPSPKVSA